MVSFGKHFVGILVLLNVLIRMMMSYECITNMDCSLNGICNCDNVCICDDQWYGDQCDLLRIMATIKNNGYKQNNYSSWGGSIIFDSKTKTYNMFVARMSLHCGLTSWTTNSEIVHAISKNKSNILGPYEFNKVLVDRFSHNPTIHEFNGTYYLYHIGCGHNTTEPITDCTNGTTPSSSNASKNKNKKDSCDGPHWTGVQSSKELNINSPWVQSTKEIELITNRSANWTTNPAPLYLANGTIYFLYREPATKWPYVYPPNDTSERLGMSMSQKDVNSFDFDGPFVDMTTYEPIANYALEDPYIWMDFRNNFHMITHKKKPNYGPNDGTAGHLFSYDGLHWNISMNSPYNNTIIFDDGSSIEVSSRERPQLVIDNGRVRYVSSGAKSGYHDYTYTVVQPVFWNSSDYYA